MVYGPKAFLPTDIDYGALRVKLYISKQNESNLKDTLDQLDEARDIDYCSRAWYQQALRRYHSRHIRKMTLQVGDLVLQQVQTNKDSHK